MTVLEAGLDAKGRRLPRRWALTRTSRSRAHVLRAACRSRREVGQTWGSRWLVWVSTPSETRRCNCFARSENQSRRWSTQSENHATQVVHNRHCDRAVVCCLLAHGTKPAHFCARVLLGLARFCPRALACARTALANAEWLPTYTQSDAHAHIQSREFAHGDVFVCDRPSFRACCLCAAIANAYVGNMSNCWFANRWGRWLVSRDTLISGLMADSYPGWIL